MRRKQILKFTAILLVVFFVFNIFSAQVSRSGPLDNITYPVAELGNCGSKEECKIYCDKEENIGACIVFAEKKKLFKQEEIEKAKKFAKLKDKDGPGGCSGHKECRAYCDDMNNIDECLDFARQNNLMSPDELREAEQVARALKRGVEMPGGCKTKESCEEYCDIHDHFNECIKFAEAAGFVSEKEANMLKKTGGAGPGGCMGKKECDLFCDNPSNMEVCMEYAIKYDLMPPEEMEEAKMMLQAIKKGAKMPNCRSEEECDIYCSQPEHMEECMEFALAAGFMSKEEAEQSRRMLEAGFTSGPGGCRDKDGCEEFCNNPDNVEKCIEFAYKMGEISEENYGRMMENKERMLMGGPGGCGSGEECRAYCDNPNNIEECTEFAFTMGEISEGEYEMMKEGRRMDPRFGPGGCQTPEECERYCQNPDHFEECDRFHREDEKNGYGVESSDGDVNWMEKQGTGPGGCITPEECKHYCSDPGHIEECRRFGSIDPGEYHYEDFQPGFDPEFKECNSPEECEVYYRTKENMYKEEYGDYHEYEEGKPVIGYEYEDHYIEKGEEIYHDKSQEEFRHYDVNMMPNESEEEFYQGEQRGYQNPPTPLEVINEISNNFEEKINRFDEKIRGEAKEPYNDSKDKPGGITPYIKPPEDDLCRYFKTIPSCDYITESERELCYRCR